MVLPDDSGYNYFFFFMRMNFPFFGNAKLSIVSYIFYANTFRKGNGVKYNQLVINTLILMNGCELFPIRNW